MKYYSGFSLKNEEYLFDDFITDTDYTICGFSYGAIKAYKRVLFELESKKRVDRLILLSPAFFQTKPLKFKRLQKLAYAKDKESYINNFIKLCFEPYKQKNIKQIDTNIDELEELLDYEWDIDELISLEKKGVKIEVYLGGKDKIIDVNDAREFFVNIGTLTYIKDANHFLQEF